LQNICASMRDMLIYRAWNMAATCSIQTTWMFASKVSCVTIQAKGRVRMTLHPKPNSKTFNSIIGNHKTLRDTTWLHAIVFFKFPSCVGVRECLPHT
jgi:hypothetical protein